MLRIFSLDGISKDRVESIIKILNKLSNHKNPHIIKFYEASFDHDMTYLGIVSEYLDKQYAFPLKEVDIWSIIQELLLASSQFHPKRIHGKLQLLNLFQNKGKTILMFFIIYINKTIKIFIYQHQNLLNHKYINQIYGWLVICFIR